MLPTPAHSLRPLPCGTDDQPPDEMPSDDTHAPTRPASPARRGLLSAGLGAALTAPLAAPALAQAAPELRWRLSSAYSKTLDILFGAPESLKIGRAHV